MLLSGANRLYLRRILRWRVTRIALLLLFVINIFDILRIQRDIVHGDREHRLRSGSGAVRRRERVYIASMHWNNAEVLKDYWNDAVIKLTETFGADNVFVSIYESGSWDDSKEALRMLDAELEKRNVPRRVEVSETTHYDEITKPEKERGEGWIDTSRGRELRRIPYLAKLRNKTIQDLIELSKKGITFDKVLFLNDVVFTVEDVLTLMDTNGGNYAAACSMDFSKPPLYYDTFALRDIEGHAHVMQTWPYFRSRTSRNALVNHLGAVPSSCPLSPSSRRRNFASVLSPIPLPLTTSRAPNAASSMPITLCPGQKASISTHE
ncbi:hypothetical protein FP744_10005992 [Trichoderma asperellum]